MRAGTRRRGRATRRSGKTRSRSPATCSRWSPAAWSASEQHLATTARAATCCCRSGSNRATRTRPATRCSRWSRSIRWDEQRFGLELDLDRFMIVAVADFNMGAMENKGLNIFNTKYVFATPRIATDADFAGVESVVGARVLPQLDRQPRHLPRLVPADAEGRPDGLPRPGVLGRHDGGRQRTRQRAAASARAVKRIEDVRVLRAAQFPEDAGPMAHPIRPDALPGDQQLLHGHRLREGRRGHPDAADAGRPRRLPARHGPVLRASRRAGGDLRRLRRRDRRRQRSRPVAVRPLVRAGRHAAAARRAAATTRRRAATGSKSSSTVRRRPARRPRRRCTSRWRSAWSRPWPRLRAAVLAEPTARCSR